MNEPLRTTSRPVILMRPGEANNRLAELLEAQGIHAVRWPAFSIELPEETDHITERLSNLDDVEMVVLPSPASVAAAAHWVREWPEHITLATVGEGTARVIRAAWGPKVKLIYPEGDASHSGSEALWPLVQAHAFASALFARADRTRVAPRTVPPHRERCGGALYLYPRAARTDGAAAPSSGKGDPWPIALDLPHQH